MTMGWIQSLEALTSLAKTSAQSQARDRLRIDLWGNYSLPQEHTEHHCAAKTAPCLSLSGFFWEAPANMHNVQFDSTYSRHLSTQAIDLQSYCRTTGGSTRCAYACFLHVGPTILLHPLSWNVPGWCMVDLRRPRTFGDHRGRSGSSRRYATDVPGRA